MAFQNQDLPDKMTKGVYVPSTNPDSLLLIDCLRQLYDDHPSVVFTSIDYDKDLGGYNICFSEPDDSVVLERNYLKIGAREIWIYPLTTFLTVRRISKNSSFNLKNELKKALVQKFGAILDIIEVDQDWRIVVDVPEFNGLRVFYKETGVGASEERRNLSVSLPKWNETFTVAFWCRHCRKNGHFQHECNLRTTPENGVGAENDESKSVKFPQKDPSPCKDSSLPETRKDSSSAAGSCREPPFVATGELSKFMQKSINSIAESIGRETVLNSGMIAEGQTVKKESGFATNAVASSLLADKEIKKENGGKVGEKNGSHKVSDPVKEEPRDHVDETSLNSAADVVSSDDDIQFVGVSNKSPGNSSRDSNINGRADAAYNSEDASRSPTNRTNNYFFPYTGLFSSTPGTSASNKSINFTPAKPASRVEVTSVLSERLQECINEACNSCRVLDRKTLDAFLIHVKKKSNPVRVALNFTKNSDGLKEQLEKILKIYYNTPQTGTKEDIQFIKWLDGLVKRFDGTIPRKRKRNERSPGESPTKK